MNVKINKERVGKFIVGAGKVAIYGLSCLTLIAPHVENSIGAMKRLTAKADYSGVIKAILNSDMLGSYMKEAVDVIQKDRDEEYYKSIIEIVESNMLGSYKIDMIKKISQD